MKHCLRRRAGARLLLLALVLCSASALAAERARRGLEVIYDFAEAEGEIVRDRAGSGEPLDLRIENAMAVKRAPGTLEVRGDTLIRSKGAATRLIEAIRRSGALTVEAWIRPAKTNQTGPARIVTLSRNSGARNFTLGQDVSRFDMRLRTSGTSGNGIPSLGAPNESVRTALTHVVYTRARGGRARIYVDGKQVAEKKIGGSTSGWDRSLGLALANEMDGKRPWLGTYHLVAIYSRQLSPKEVAGNFRAGAAPSGELAAATEPTKPLFETHIASILARHCLECHDSASKKGRLDLSTKKRAFAGGREGVAIVPGKSDKSLLWEVVAEDEMPKKRPPLSAEEKKLLKRWIDEGAKWTLEFIDPTRYVHDGRIVTDFVRRLTVEEYIETVRATLGVDIAEETRKMLPPDLRADGFTNTAYNLNVDLKHVEAYAELASIIVSRVNVPEFADRFVKRRRLTDDDMGKLISSMGEWVYRGPLEEREIVLLRGISTTVASAGGSVDEATSFVLEAMIQSPRFIYRIERQRGVAGEPVTDYELASRLSYAIWGSSPDRELMKLAAAAELSDDDVLSTQIDRMLEDPRALSRSARFIEEWLDLPRLANLRPNAEHFPNWSPEIANDMREETVAFFTEVVWKQKRPLGDLLNAQVTFLTPRLARHYGLEPRAGEGSDGGGSNRYDLSAVPSRGGILTQGSVLTIGGDEASMVTRGLFVLHDLLRGSVKDPPPCVDTTPVPTSAGRTHRDISEARIANPSCGGCHSKFEPLAFGLEKFDGLGTYHEKDGHGNALRDDGSILFPGTAEVISYKNSAELMDLLAGSARVRECITWKLAQFVLGRPLVGADAPTLDKIHESAMKSGGTYFSLIRAIVSSDLVRLTMESIE